MVVHAYGSNYISRMHCKDIIRWPDESTNYFLSVFISSNPQELNGTCYSFIWTMKQTLYQYNTVFWFWLFRILYRRVYKNELGTNVHEDHTRRTTGLYVSRHIRTCRKNNYSFKIMPLILKYTVKTIIFEKNEGRIFYRLISTNIKSGYLVTFLLGCEKKTGGGANAQTCVLHWRPREDSLQFFLMYQFLLSIFKYSPLRVRHRVTLA